MNMQLKWVAILNKESLQPWPWLYMKYWNENIIILTKKFSLAAPEVVIVMTYGAGSGKKFWQNYTVMRVKKFIKMANFCFSEDPV